MGWMAEVGAELGPAAGTSGGARARVGEAACPPPSSPVPPAASAAPPPSACSPTATTSSRRPRDRRAGTPFAADLTTREGNAGAVAGRAGRASAGSTSSSPTPASSTSRPVGVPGGPLGRDPRAAADEPVPARQVRLGRARRERAAAASSPSPPPTRWSPRPTRRPTSRPSTACSGWSRRSRWRAPSTASPPPPSAPATCARRWWRARSPTRRKAHGISEDEVLEDVILAPHAVKRLIEPDEVAGVIAFLAGPGRRGVHRRARDHGPRLERAIDLPDRLTELLEHAVRASDPRSRCTRSPRCGASWTPSSACRPGARWTPAAPTAPSPARSGISRQAAHRRYRELAAATEPPPGADPPALRVAPRPAPPSSSRARRRPRSAPPAWAPSTCCSGILRAGDGVAAARAARRAASRSRPPARPPSRRWPARSRPDDRRRRHRLRAPRVRRGAAPGRGRPGPRDQRRRPAARRAARPRRRRLPDARRRSASAPRDVLGRSASAA